MKKSILIFSLMAMLASPAFAKMDTPIRAGVDFALPYSLLVDGNSNTNRMNFNIGVDGRYQFTENWNAGFRFSFDVEAHNGLTRQVGLAPGTQWHWMPNERFNPYFRFDLPILFRDQQDIGLGGGAGVVWNLGDAIGVDNMTVRYDFALNYYVGVGSAVDLLALDLFKIGFDYKF